MSGKLLLPLLLPLAGCAATGDYPSLARRAVETEPPAAPAPAPVDTALGSAEAAQLAGLLERHRTASARFAASAAEAERLVPSARGAVAGAESWSVAQRAVSRAVGARAESMTALADIDALYIRLLDAESQGGPAGPARDVAAARAPVADEIAGQARRISALAAALAD